MLTVLMTVIVNVVCVTMYPAICKRHHNCFEWIHCFVGWTVSGCIQGWEHARHLGACRAPTYLQGVTQGEWIPAECLGRNEKKAVFSFCSSLAIYNKQVTQRKELNKERVVTHYCQ